MSKDIYPLKNSVETNILFVKWKYYLYTHVYTFNIKYYVKYIIVIAVLRDVQ